MTTREDVLDAISRIKQAGYSGAATATAQLELLFPVPEPEYRHILDRLRAGFPQVFPPAGRSPVAPPPPPGPRQGAGVRAMQHAQAALSQQQSAVADFDRQVIEALLHVHQTTVEGRALLDTLDSQIESAALGWDLRTGVGAREFQRFLITKLDQVIRVVEAGNDDDAAKRALAAAWAALYAAQGSPTDPPAGRLEPTPDSPAGRSEPASADYLAELPPDALGPGDTGRTAHGAPTPPMAPALSGFGGPVPMGGAGPTGGAQPGLPLTGSPLAAHHERLPVPRDDDPFTGADDPTSVEDPVPADELDTDEPAAESTTATLPDGQTVTAATPQLAAIIQAAADGTPVAEAFGQQGVSIPPPGTAVAAPLALSRVVLGDIGMFTDRHALAVGDSRALLDGQLQRIGNVSGPSFLGWQHPPMPMEPPAQSPTPTRPSAGTGQPGR